jgi:hypothetical protein
LLPPGNCLVRAAAESVGPLEFFAAEGGAEAEGAAGADAPKSGRKLLRSTLRAYVKALGISKETVVTLEYAPAVAPPRIGDSRDSQEWIAALDASDKCVSPAPTPLPCTPARAAGGAITYSSNGTSFTHLWHALLLVAPHSPPTAAAASPWLACTTASCRCTASTPPATPPRSARSAR